MTIAIRIENKDKARSAKIEVQDFDIKRRVIACTEEIDLPPGTARTVYVHSSRQVLVSEVPMEAHPAPSTNTEPRGGAQENA